MEVNDQDIKRLAQEEREQERRERKEREKQERRNRKIKRQLKRWHEDLED